MDEERYIGGKRHLSSVRAGAGAGVTNDYVARLCRQGKVGGERIGGTWYVDVDSLAAYLCDVNREREERKQTLSVRRKEELAEHAALMTLPEPVLVIAPVTERAYAFALSLSLVVAVSAFSFMPSVRTGTGNLAASVLGTFGVGSEVLVHQASLAASALHSLSFEDIRTEAAIAPGALFTAPVAGE